MPTARVARFDMVGMTNRLLAGVTPQTIDPRPARPASATQDAYRAACTEVREALEKAGYHPDDKVVQDVTRKAIAGYIYNRISQPVEV